MTLEILLSHPAVQALGRALLHFIWQGSLLAALLWVVKTWAPPTAARLRYAAASSIMLAMPLVLVVTAAKGSFHGGLRSTPASAARASQRAGDSVSVPPQGIRYTDPPGTPGIGISGWVVCIWITGVLLFALRAAGGWLGAQRLKRGLGSVSAELEDMLRDLKFRLGISAPVRLCTSALVRVPTAIGWIRPYVLLPVTALTGLSEPQIGAILAHELAHIRRRDYLMSLLQTAVETALFYHPAVWWVGKQMRLEREHCCDDIAVEICGNALQYATALAEMEQIRSGVPEPALAATGGELLGRIRRLLGKEKNAWPDRAPRSLGSMAAAAIVSLGLAVTTIFSLRAAPQDQPRTGSAKPVDSTRPAFEAASIRPHSNATGRDLRFEPTPGGRFTSTAPLRWVIAWAYGVFAVNHNFRLTGGPDWINGAEGVYDIEATGTIPEGLSTSAHDERMRLMVQALLADRFKLAVHRETKEMTVYALVVGKGGPKLQKADIEEKDCAQPPPAPPSTDGTPMPRACHQFNGGRGRGLHGRAVDMGDVVQDVENWTDRPFIDKTGIKGLYRIQTQPWLPMEVGPAPPPGTKQDGIDVADLPTIFTVFEGLGLKMESQKATIDVYVIDHVERPSEN
jgi:uncharacterized protein (TIGR03435 family)